MGNENGSKKIAVDKFVVFMLEDKGIDVVRCLTSFDSAFGSDEKLSFEFVTPYGYAYNFIISKFNADPDIIEVADEDDFDSFY